MKKRLFMLLILCFTISMCPIFTVSATENEDATDIATPDTDIATPDAENAPNHPPEISAGSAVIMDAKTGIILYSKNMIKREYPASVTKVLTALVALEKGETDLEQRISFYHDSVHSLPYDSSNIAMNVGDTLSFRDAFYGILLASANEVSNAIAEHFGGSIDNFVSMMNDRAKELGAVNSQFANPHGLHHPGHYTCAYDMALFMREAIKHPFFKQVISTYDYEIPPTEKQPLERPLHNTNKMIVPVHTYYYPDVVGGKTGYTDQARHTLVTYAVKNDIELIVAVLYEPAGHQYIDTAALLDYGFSNYHFTSLLVPGGYTGFLNVIQSDPADLNGINKLNVYTVNGIDGLFPSRVNSETVTLNPEAFPDLEPPITKGTKVGTLKVLFEDIELGSVDLFAAESVHPVQILHSPAAESLPPPQEFPEEADVLSGDADKPRLRGNTFLITIMYISTTTVILIFGYSLIAFFIKKARNRRKDGLPAETYNNTAAPRE